MLIEKDFIFSDFLGKNTFSRVLHSSIKQIQFNPFEQLHVVAYSQLFELTSVTLFILSAFKLYEGDV